MCGWGKGGGMWVGECREEGCVWVLCAGQRDVWEHVRGSRSVCVGKCGEEGCVWVSAGRRDVGG